MYSSNYTIYYQEESQYIWSSKLYFMKTYMTSNKKFSNTVFTKIKEQINESVDLAAHVNGLLYQGYFLNAIIIPCFTALSLTKVQIFTMLNTGISP